MRKDRSVLWAAALGLPIVLITIYEVVGQGGQGFLGWAQLAFGALLVGLMISAPMRRPAEVRGLWLSPWSLNVMAGLACLAMALWSILDASAERQELAGPYLIYVALSAMVWAAGRALAGRALGDVDSIAPPGPDVLVRWTLIAIPLAALAAAGIRAVAGEAGSAASSAGLAALAAVVVAPPAALSFGLSALMLVAAVRGTETKVRPASWRAARMGRDFDRVLFADASMFISGSPSILDFGVSESASADQLVGLLSDLDSLPPDRLDQVPGLGCRASIEGREVLIGSPELLESRGIDISRFKDKIAGCGLTGASPTLIATGGQCMGFLALASTLRVEAALVVESLKAAGMIPAVARPKNPDEIRALERLPAVEQADAPESGLAGLIDAWHAAGSRVALVSGPRMDPGLAKKADLAIVLGCRPEAVPPAADVIIEQPDLDGALHGISLAAAMSRQAGRLRIAAAVPHAIALVVAAGVLQGTVGMGASPLLACGALAAACALILLAAMPIAAWEPSRKIDEAILSAVDALSKASGEKKTIQ